VTDHDSRVLARRRVTARLPDHRPHRAQCTRRRRTHGPRGNPRRRRRRCRPGSRPPTSRRRHRRPRRHPSPPLSRRRHKPDHRPIAPTGWERASQAAVALIRNRQVPSPAEHRRPAMQAAAALISRLPFRVSSELPGRRALTELGTRSSASPMRASMHPVRAVAPSPQCRPSRPASSKANTAARRIGANCSAFIGWPGQRHPSLSRKHQSASIRQRASGLGVGAAMRHSTGRARVAHLEHARAELHTRGVA